MKIRLTESQLRGLIENTIRGILVENDLEEVKLGTPHKKFSDYVLSNDDDRYVYKNPKTGEFLTNQDGTVYSLYKKPAAERNSAANSSRVDPYVGYINPKRKKYVYAEVIKDEDGDLCAVWGDKPDERKKLPNGICSGQSKYKQHDMSGVPIKPGNGVYINTQDENAETNDPDYVLFKHPVANKKTPITNQDDLSPENTEDDENIEDGENTEDDENTEDNENAEGNESYEETQINQRAAPVLDSISKIITNRLLKDDIKIKHGVRATNIVATIRGKICYEVYKKENGKTGTRLREFIKKRNGKPFTDKELLSIKIQHDGVKETINDYIFNYVLESVETGTVNKINSAETQEKINNYVDGKVEVYSDTLDFNGGYLKKEIEKLKQTVLDDEFKNGYKPYKQTNFVNHAIGNPIKNFKEYVDTAFNYWERNNTSSVKKTDKIQDPKVNSYIDEFLSMNPSLDLNMKTKNKKEEPLNVVLEKLRNIDVNEYGGVDNAIYKISERLFKILPNDIGIKFPEISVETTNPSEFVWKSNKLKEIFDKIQGDPKNVGKTLSDDIMKRLTTLDYDKNQNKYAGIGNEIRLLFKNAAVDGKKQTFQADAEERFSKTQELNNRKEQIKDIMKTDIPALRQKEPWLKGLTLSQNDIDKLAKSKEEINLDTVLAALKKTSGKRDDTSITKTNDEDDGSAFNV